MTEPDLATDRTALEAERDFLLRSLSDLEADVRAGELTPAQFDQLAGTYTARAAAVLRTLDQATGAHPAPPADAPSRTRRRRLGTGAVLVAVVALAALLLPDAIGDRRSGQTITGNAQSTSEPTAEALARTVAQSPEDPQARLAYARYLLDQGDLVEAIRQYDAVTRLDPSDPEALAYGGWILALAGMSDPRAGTTASGMNRIDQAIAADPTYPDAHVFRGMVLLDAGDAAGAVPELERYLALAPDGPLRAQVEGLLDQARRQTPADPP